jgi:hypothetical protein
VEQSIRNERHIRDVLDQVCARNEILILSTPYMRFESSFLRLEDGLFHAHASMDLEDAKYGLRSPDLKIRFPHGEHFFEGATRLLGLGRAQGRPSLQLAIPATLEDGDYRRAYRAERVGRVPVTFSSRKYELLLGTLVNISTSGLRVFLNRSYEPDELLVEDMIHVAFSLSDSIRVNTTVKVRFIRDKVFGAEFRPALDGPLLDSLSRWVFQRREEDLAAQGRTLAAEEAARKEVRGDAKAAAERVLISASAALGEQLAAMLPGDPPLRRLAPTIQSMRELGSGGRALVLFHVDSPSWETRKRIKALAEALPPAMPLVLIGTGLENGQLFEMGTEVKAVWTYPLPPNPGSIFPRLLQGIIRKHFPG